MKKKGFTKRADFIGVVQWPLFEPDDEQIDKLIADPDFNPMQRLSEILPNGYELALRYSPDYDSFEVFLKAWTAANENAGWWLAATDETLHSALCTLYYKHFGQFEGGKWDSAVIPRKKRK